MTAILNLVAMWVVAIVLSMFAADALPGLLTYRLPEAKRGGRKT